jgi:hypothetical protein
MAGPYQPKPEHKFTFGLWTIGNVGRDPFGDVVRPSLKPTYSVRKLSELGAYGVNLHDNDLVPFDASANERDNHIDLNDQKMSRFDQDLRFGSENIKLAFFVVKFLEDAQWDGSRHFDAHAYRTEDEQGVWDFAAGCMRSYLILKEKAHRFNADPEIQGLLAEIRLQDRELEGLMSTYSAENAKQLRAIDFKPDELGKKGLQYEKLDQLTFDILMGVR